MEYKRMSKAFFVKAYRGYDQEKRHSIVKKMGEITLDYEPSPGLFDEMSPNEIEEASRFIAEGRARIRQLRENENLKNLPYLISGVCQAIDRGESAPWLTDEIKVEIFNLKELLLDC